MKTILVTAYAVNPYKGSEDGMGWNFACQIARFNKAIIVTRKNNKVHIDRFLSENDVPMSVNMTFMYYDTPYWMRFWKKGGKGALIYYYMWQYGLVKFIKKSNLNIDIAHNLNFHNDWTPSFLWKLNKPFVWGPVGHHPLIPKKFILPIYGIKAWLKDRATWMVKNWFWNIDPLLYATKNKADVILAMNNEAKEKLNVSKDKFIILPSVGTDDLFNEHIRDKEGFNIISTGRFTWLKGFDVTIKAFASFIKLLTTEEKQKTTLTLIGSGETLPFLEKLILKLGIQENTKIIAWIERDKLKEKYNNSHVFLFPSHEGAGMVVAEALSCYLPVVCFDNCGPGEFINETCGIKIPYSKYTETIENFSKALHLLYSNPQLYSNLSTGARKRFETNFAWDVKGNILKEVYENI